jgi:hypothetical protein
VTPKLSDFQGVSKPLPRRGDDAGYDDMLHTTSEHSGQTGWERVRREMLGDLTIAPHKCNNLRKNVKCTSSVRHKAQQVAAEGCCKHTLNVWQGRAAYTFSVVSSRRFISCVASPSRRHSEATDTAVTWPCHLRPSPSTFPRTASRKCS